jgi:predicted amidohydrolase
MSEMIKIAGVQMDPVISDSSGNLARCLELMKTAVKEGAQLIVFPEAALSGYVFDSLDEVLPFIEPIPGPNTEKITAACRKLGAYVIIGLLEKHGTKYYNTAAFIGPLGLIGKYRKLHLPYIGIDRFLNHGDLPLKVYDSPLGKIGLSICYDLDFPEHARVLALMGTEVIVTVANWPEGIEFIPDYVVCTRARENMVHHIAVNRVGEERGVRFIGRSKFADCMGAPLAEGKAYREDIIYTEINPASANEKCRVIVPGELEVDCLKDRRPEFYGLMAQPLVDNSRIRR